MVRQEPEVGAAPVAMLFFGGRRMGGGAAGPPASSMIRMQRAESSFLVNLGLSPWSNGGHLGRRLGYITCL